MIKYICYKYMFKYTFFNIYIYIYKHYVPIYTHPHNITCITYILITSAECHHLILNISFVY